jgi:Zn-dependent M28 family amino/carboxypeptidase
VVLPEPSPEKGSYYRSDHFEFAKVGVPALYITAGTNLVGKPAGYVAQREEEFAAKDYHKVSDEVKPYWDLSGAAEDVRLLWRVGWQVAEDRRWPEWKKGSEFKARREAQLKSARP